ncbi:MAG: poly-gamma-glutamate biosynthesis protein PgsC [Acidobacteriota bacterium]|nr:poly-gamma-glutamate biosynthesis protein PgsC [Acidobacteriota bacterium]
MPSGYSSFFLGLILALIYAEVTGLSPGGLIVPGYFALYLNQPWRPLTTLAAAFLTLLIYRLLSRYFIIFGRRRFVLMVLAGACLGEAWSLALPHLLAEPVGLRVIGWVVPGILASTLERQKILPVLSSLIFVSVLTFFLSQLFF